MPIQAALFLMGLVNHVADEGNVDKVSALCGQVVAEGMVDIVLGLVWLDIVLAIDATQMKRESGNFGQFVLAIVPHAGTFWSC